MRVILYVLLMSLATGAMAQGTTIPAAFQGDWSKSLKGCNDPYEDTSGLTVTASSLSLYDGVGIVEAVEEASATKIKVAAFWNAEGDTYRDTHELNLSDNGNMLSMTGIGRTGKAEFIRCPA